MDIRLLYLNNLCFSFKKNLLRIKFPKYLEVKIIKSKILIGIMLCLFLAISGCGQQGANMNERDNMPSDYKEVIQETERRMGQQAEAMDVEPSGDDNGEESCVVLQQCSSGADLCWQGRCWTEEELFEEYEKCEDMKCNHLDCENCDSGHEQCTVATSAGSKMYYVCVDCVKGMGCKAGFECEDGRCI